MHSLGIYFNALVNGNVSTFKLKNTLYVPQLCENLISTRRLTEHRVAIIHIRNMCKMIDNYDEGNLIMIGQKCDGLWRLNLWTFNEPRLQILWPPLLPATKVCIALQRWHARLGHVNVHTIQNMRSLDFGSSIPSFDKITPLVCSDCPLAKAIALHFLSTETGNACIYLGCFFMLIFLVLFK